MVKRIGVDIGGTFTDVVGFDAATGRLKVLKVLTTPREPWKGLIRGIEGLGWNLESVNVIVHASTLGTNMLFGQAGLEPPRVLLLTNEGFRDILEIGRQNRPELYNLFFSKPKPLVPRERRIGVRGRIAADGRELEPLDVDAVRRVARQWCGKVDVFAIVFLHSYTNPSHEVEAAKIIREECPKALVVTSHEVDPQPKEFERTSTTVLNALLKPMLSKYLGKVWDELKSRGFNGKLLVMQSSGGVADHNTAIRFPAAFIESGPAAGAIAVAYFSQMLGVDKALGFDMGGTTAKASSIVNGEPMVTPEYEVGGKVHMGRLVRGSGYPVRYPYIDLAEVSAGGGTIAWIDAGGALRVGPMSAGADPGPACYGKGGQQPTVTDANYVLGRLPDQLAGGRIKLRRELAEKAIEKIAEPLGLTVQEAALAVLRIANTVMARALRLVTLEKGMDPREFTLFAFGGAGPLHAVQLAEELGIKHIIIPPYPGVFSALGLLVADYRHDLYVNVNRRVDEIDSKFLEEKFMTLEKKAISILEEEHIPHERIKLLRFLDMRYAGQAYDLTVPYSGNLATAVEEFHRLHAARYGYEMREEPVIVTTARLVAYGLTEKPQFRTRRVEGASSKPEPRTTRRVYFEQTEWTNTPVYLRDDLKAGMSLKGPALIVSDDSTVLLPPGYSLSVDDVGALHIVKI
jgi:N-methylhydantoinase A